MSEITDPEYNFEEGNVPVTQAEDEAKGMRAALAKAEKEKAELSDQLVKTQKTQAIKDAELTLNDVQLAALEASHQGEWTADALKATAENLGWVKEESAPVVNAQEAASLERAASLGAGARTPDLSAELESKIAGWEQLGRTSMSEDQFINEVGNTLGGEFFEDYKQTLRNRGWIS